MAEMSKWERVEAALAGEAVDRPPVSLWHHFPERDQTAEALADSTLAWQEQYDNDFIKLMPPGDYATVDWGLTSEYQGSRGGTRETTHYPITTADDWRKVAPLPVDRGMHREAIEAARQTNERLGGAVPLLQTIFSPLTIAMKLSDGRVLDHLQAEPAVVHAALAAITTVTCAMTAATLERGASGIFFATQCATTDLMTVAAYEEFGAQYDRQVLAAAGASRFTMLHIHGEQIMFDQLMDYPVHAINWHDRRTAPTLAEGARRSGKCAIGGIHEHDIATMTPDEAAAQARDAVAATGGRHVMIGPGCVIPITTPPANIVAVIHAVREG
ncbi:MAG: uroporphyrinogen decarboxylase [Thermomicrobia bacterium]|nr:uroporphyrinogen decarboxylase [Thermomicrobia bacterium]